MRKFAVVVVGVLALAGCSQSDGASSAPSDVVTDVKVTSCALGPLDRLDVDTATEKTIQTPQATIEITNSGKDAADYFVEVTFASTDGNTQYGTGAAKVSGVPAGKSQGGTVQGTQEASGALNCTVTSAVRM